MIVKKDPKLEKRVAVRALLGPALLIPLVFIPAGTFNYPQGILYVALNIVILVLTYLSVRSDPELINERLAPGKGMKGWDKVYFAITTPLFFITTILAALDAGRFHWSPRLPVYVYAAAVALYVLGQLIFIWARKTNRYFSSVVRIQKDRGHRVCQDGPYKFVRHPGYVGGLLFTATIPLILGSLWALIPTAATVVLMFIRTALEDRTLEAELEGYKQYKRRVRYRLIPFIW